MNVVFSVKKAILICAVVLLGCTLTSWQDRAPRAETSTQDTVPPKREKKIRDLDEALAELDNAHEDLEKNLKEVDWEKLQADIKQAMKNVDVKKVQSDLQRSLSEIDVEKMRHDVETSVAKIDWDKMKQEIEKVKSVNLEDVKQQMAEVKVQMEKIKPELEKNLRKAHESIEKAKTQMQGYKSFVDGLAQDGLVNKQEGYTIEHKNGQLIINGKEQPADVYNKYRTFLEKNKTFTLKKNNDDFTIHTD